MLNIISKNQRNYVNKNELREWENNHRIITGDGLERLKKQILELGQYKPLLIMTDGTVLGGNMRLRAYKEIDSIQDLWVNIIDFREKGGKYKAFINDEEQVKEFHSIEQAKIEYSLSDNDRIGQYLIDKTMDYIKTIPYVDMSYSIDIYAPNVLVDLEAQRQFDPSQVNEGASEFEREGVDFFTELKVRCLMEQDFLKLQKLLSTINIKITEKTKAVLVSDEPLNQYDENWQN